jgi:hypothetical protein
LNCYDDKNNKIIHMNRVLIVLKMKKRLRRRLVV